MRYPPNIREEIFSSIFCNGNRKDMHVAKEIVQEHFKNSKKTSTGIGRGKFIKKLGTTCIKNLGSFFVMYY